ncbi:hypothetical protein IK112_02230 [Candidatus Saccharibacteria bacterium]|nr:hypothetical protein [Candidatus Saccharibacteria bacterium]
MFEQGGPNSWWWSATAASDIKTNALGISDGINSQYNADRLNGFTLRRLCGKTKKPPVSLRWIFEQISSQLVCKLTRS